MDDSATEPVTAKNETVTKAMQGHTESNTFVLTGLVQILKLIIEFKWEKTLQSLKRQMAL